MSHSINQLNKTYSPHAIEATWSQRWEANGYFKPSGKGEAYCIVLPPPNVTGSLHMGHGFQVTLMDALIRYQRMQGKNVLWQGGTDHAGIATQMVVERQLLSEGISRHELGREKFVDAIWKWKKQSGGRITQQLRCLGASIDWSRERFTQDAEFSAAVEKVFIDLHQQGLIYRGQRLVNWDPHLLTAVSDLEVINNEEQGSLWTILYPIVDSNNTENFLAVATTRPETLFGDVAVAVNPNDTRYQAFIGKQLKLPLTERTIPIIADESVEMSFGSGCVKITPAHDFNDYALAQRHQLNAINIFTPNAHLNDQVPKAYQGLERFAARQKVINDLQNLKLIKKIEPHVLKIPRGDRSGVIIEPYLTDQWFMSMKPLAQPIIKTLVNGKVDFIPETWKKVCLQWLENIEDWCISRQLWWGHRIPAWYDTAGNIYVGESEEKVRNQHNLAQDITLHQDEDVLDTWFSSALWPFVTLGWPNNTRELATFYPTNVLVTGFDIIFFWVARMLMLGQHFTGQIPFKEVYVTGLIRDHDGQKMSKSKGNVLDPVDVIQGISLEDLLRKRCQGLMQPQMAHKVKQATQQQFPQGIPALGTDALRFTYCALASPTRDIRFDIQRTEGYRNFCNKLWNAARFVLMHIPPNLTEDHSKTSLSLSLNRAFSSQLQSVIKGLHQHFQNYRFDLMAQIIYEFVWNEYCDWYLELAKPILFKPQVTPEKIETWHNLIYILEICLRLLHPIIPFITEEIWQTIAPLARKNGPTIMLQSYPVPNDAFIDQTAEQDLAWLKKIITTIRTLRSEINIPPGKKIPIYFNKGNVQDQKNTQRFFDDLIQVAKLDSIQWIDPNTKAKLGPTSIALIDSLEILIPMQGLIDIEYEKQRLQKEIYKLEKEIARSQNKLNNPAFIEKAPKAILEQEHQRLKVFTHQKEKLHQQIKQL